MRYVVAVNGVEHEVTIDGSSVRIEHFEADARLVELEGTPVRLAWVDGRVYRVLTRPGPEAGRFTIHLEGYRFDVEALDERMRAIRQLAGSTSQPAGPATLSAPMPGLVARMLVQPGDRVQAGQGVVVIEAMKMENELRAPRTGVVRSVDVAAGSAVEKGTILLTLDPPG